MSAVNQPVPARRPISIAEELRRVIPVVRALAAAGAIVSIDTRHAQVMGEAIAAGATIVNDITALTGDPASLDLLARSRSLGGADAYARRAPQHAGQSGL